MECDKLCNNELNKVADHRWQRRGGGEYGTQKNVYGTVRERWPVVSIVFPSWWWTQMQINEWMGTRRARSLFAFMYNKEERQSELPVQPAFIAVTIVLMVKYRGCGENTTTHREKMLQHLKSDDVVNDNRVIFCFPFFSSFLFLFFSFASHISYFGNEIIDRVFFPSSSSITSTHNRIPSWISSFFLVGRPSSWLDSNAQHRKTVLL